MADIRRGDGGVVSGQHGAARDLYGRSAQVGGHIVGDRRPGRVRGRRQVAGAAALHRHAARCQAAAQTGQPECRPSGRGLDDPRCIRLQVQHSGKPRQPLHHRLELGKLHLVAPQFSADRALAQLVGRVLIGSAGLYARCPGDILQRWDVDGPVRKNRASVDCVEAGAAQRSVGDRQVYIAHRTSDRSRDIGVSRQCAGGRDRTLPDQRQGVGQVGIAHGGVGPQRVGGQGLPVVQPHRRVEMGRQIAARNDGVGHRCPRPGGVESGCEAGERALVHGEVGHGCLARDARRGQAALNDRVRGQSSATVQCDRRNHQGAEIRQIARNQPDLKLRPQRSREFQAGVRQVEPRRRDRHRTGAAGVARVQTPGKRYAPRTGSHAQIRPRFQFREAAQFAA